VPDDRRGQPPPGPRRPDDRVRAAREALADAKADALAKGNRPASRDKAQPVRNAPGGSPSPARSSRRQRQDDPQPLNAAIGGLIDERGWALAAAAGSVFGRWAQIVGPELGAHTAPDGLADGELTINADSTAWATQVRLLAGQLVRRLNAELGDGAVQRVKVRGPAGPPRKAGEWRVRGGRGPRDTYG
jgi:predicted nucleic acid-binding Zn ribbon protein